MGSGDGSEVSLRVHGGREDEVVGLLAAGIPSKADIAQDSWHNPCYIPHWRRGAAIHLPYAMRSIRKYRRAFPVCLYSSANNRSRLARCR